MALHQPSTAGAAGASEGISAAAFVTPTTTKQHDAIRAALSRNGFSAFEAADGEILLTGATFCRAVPDWRAAAGFLRAIGGVQ